MARLPVVWLALLVLTPPLTGCLGSVDPAEIPPSTLSSEDWQLRDRNEQSRFVGLVKLVTLEYSPRNAPVSFTGGVILVSSTDVPLVDESRYIPAALEQAGDRYGVSFREAGPDSITFVNLRVTEPGTRYDVVSASGAKVGDAVVTTPPCGSFVVVAAFGPPAGSGGGGLLGGGSGPVATYGDAKRIAGATQC